MRVHPCTRHAKRPPSGLVRVGFEEIIFIEGVVLFRWTRTDLNEAAERRALRGGGERW
jgi:hypothetical protein